MNATAVSPSRSENGSDERVDTKDLYEVLGVKRDASKAEINDAFRRLALQYHPDRHDGEEASRRFAEISRAYAVLHDDEKRALYDALGPSRYDDPWAVYQYRQRREEGRGWEALDDGTAGSVAVIIFFLVILDFWIPSWVLGPWFYVANAFLILGVIVGIYDLAKS